MSHCKRVLVIFVWVLSHHCIANPETGTSAEPINVAGYDDINSGSLYLEELLRGAYFEIGREAAFHRLPFGRAQREANVGRMDALMAMSDLGTSENTQNLIRVPFPLIQFHLVLVSSAEFAATPANQRTIGVLRGAVRDREIVERRGYPYREYVDIDSMVRALNTHRVLGLVLTTNELNARQPQLPQDINYAIVDTLVAYHYLHKQHQAMANELHAALMSLLHEGWVEHVADKYALEDVMLPDWQALQLRESGSLEQRLLEPAQ